MRAVSAARGPAAGAGPSGLRREAWGAELPARHWGLPVLACVALAVLSLLAPAQPTYDPWAWIIWGREITQGDLVTTSGPSWKPLPVLFTTPFALMGDTAAPGAWLVVARAGGLMAIFLAFRLAARLAGAPAGAIAAVSLLLSEDFVRHFARGNSEGLLVALCLAGIALHLEGRRTAAFVAGLAAALLRPEVWPFFGLYGLWLAWWDPERRALVGVAFAVTGLLWFVPEYLGSGDFLRAAERARQPNPNSAAFAERPFIEVFRRSGGLLPVPVWLGGAAAVGFAAARRSERPAARVVIALGAVAAALMVGVALMTELGFAGNLRYVALPAALVCVLAGVGWHWLVAGVAGRTGRVGAAGAIAALLALTVPFALGSAAAFGTSLARLEAEAAVYRDLDRAISAAGGPRALSRCGHVITGPYEVQVVAWKLGRHGAEVDIDPVLPGTVLARRTVAVARDERFAPLARTRHWVVRRACG